MSNDTCTAEDCSRKPRARGLCTMHHQRWRKSADRAFLPPPPLMNPPRTRSERFYSKIAETDDQGCMLWGTKTDRGGYGQFWDKGTMRSAHRVAYEIANGPIPEGSDLDHRCHTDDASCAGGVTCKHRRCVNVAHLEPVSKAENALRGRSFAAKNAVKTHCPRNHPYDEFNTYVKPGGGRSCRKCKRERQAK